MAFQHGKKMLQMYMSEKLIIALRQKAKADGCTMVSIVETGLRTQIPEYVEPEKESA